MKGKKKIIIGLLLAIIYLVLLFISNSEIGVTWDEPRYFTCAESFSKIIEEGVQKYLECIPEHPHFTKTLSGISNSITQGFVDYTTSFRIGHFILASSFIFMFFYLLSNLFGIFTALISTITLMAMPRIFFHAHLVEMDFPVAIFVFLTTIAFYYFIEKRQFKYMLLFAIPAAFLFINKVTGLLLFVPLAFYFITTFISKEKIIIDKQKFKQIGLVTLLIIGFVFILLFGHIGQFLAPFESSAVKTNLDASKTIDVLLFNNFQGSNTLTSVALYVPLNLFSTFNSLHVVLALIGLFFAFTYSKRNKLLSLFLLVFFTFYIFFSWPTISKYDGARNFLMLFPFLAFFVGYGSNKLIAKIKKNPKVKIKYKTLKTIILIIIIITGAYTLYMAAPFYSSYFNLFVGGSAGVAENNLISVTYWQPELLQTLGFINSLPQNSSIRVIGHPQVFEWYQKAGKIREDIGINFKSIPEEYFFTVNKASYLMSLDPDEKRNNPPLDTTWELWKVLIPLYTVRDRNGVILVKVDPLPTGISWDENGELRKVYEQDDLNPIQ